MVRGLHILSTGTHCHQKNDRGLDALDMGLSNQPQSPTLTADLQELQGGILLSK